jgi:NADPH:quinone reductase-like Zn-dependent oxidoreductase
MLNPFEWLKMAIKQSNMPKFDAMDLTVSNKSVLGFNLSFFADEREVLSDMFDQVVEWMRYEKLECPNVVEMEMKNVSLAHEFLQSGKSIGKIVMRTETTRS